MKRLLLGALVGATLSACHQSAPATQPAARPTAAPAPVAATIAPARQPATAGKVPPAVLAMLRRYDLAPLWANQTATAQQSSTHTMEGFYGQPPYRISFYFKQVTRDPQQPNLFHVVGLDRYKRVITPFTGTITVQTIEPFTKEMFVDAPDSTAQAFTAAGTFELREDPATKGAGTYYGKALLDFFYDAHGHLDQAGGIDGQANPAKGVGLLFEGYQVSNQTGRRQPVAFANYYGVVVPQALNGLGIGDRSEEVNPNLARLGWNEAWENDEWWADSPRPKLNL